MSRTEFKILIEEKFWIIIFKESHSHSEDKSICRDAAQPIFKPVHRLDFETQGLLFLAREDHWEPYHALFKAKEGHSGAQKLYLAGASSPVSQRGLCRGFVGSRYRSSKRTHFSYERNSLKGFHSALEAQHKIREAPPQVSDLFRGHPYEVELISGRRHQIRAFFESESAPLVGDSLYGEKSPPPLELFSWKLNFIDPLTQKAHSVEAPLEYFAKANS